MAVLLIGTLDTKGTEVAFVQNHLRSRGVKCTLIDTGVMNPPLTEPDVTREEVFKAAGARLKDVQKEADRGKAIELAARGAARVARDLFNDNQVTGVMSLGGSAGTTIGTAAMRALPFGVPKLMVSTLASGQVRPYVGVSDIFMLNAVVDISGLNHISSTILINAAEAMMGMIRNPASQHTTQKYKPLIATTMFGVTTPCVEIARKKLEERKYEVLVFHATGSGGMAMESFIRDGLIHGVLDITTTELADEKVGGVLSAGQDRLTAAASRGVAQVISVGALDMVNFGPRETVPEKFADRLFYQHNPNVTLMRTTPEENDELGKEIAHKACAAKGPTAILVPLYGVSAIDREGEPFWWPEADQALFQSIRNWISPDVELIEMNAHINDPEFAEMAAQTLYRLLRK